MAQRFSDLLGSVRLVLHLHGYDEMSTKAMTQQRRTSAKVAASVTFTESMSIQMKKDDSLESREQTMLSVNAK